MSSSTHLNTTPTEESSQTTLANDIRALVVSSICDGENALVLTKKLRLIPASTVWKNSSYEISSRAQEVQLVGQFPCTQESSKA